MKDISIIIVSYNVRELLLQCIRSVYASSGALAVEIIVIDNNSKDDSVNAVKAAFPQVKLIANDFNAGFSGANNQGIRVAEGEFIFLLNPDTELRGDALTVLLNYMKNTPGVAVVAPRLLNRDRSLQVSAWKHPLPLDMILETFFFNFFRRLDYPLSVFSTVSDVDSLSGAALFFRRSLTGKIGLLDEELFWMEDIDFCSRAKSEGRLVLLPAAEVVHYSGESQRKNYNVAISNQLLSKLKYYKKHFSLIRRFLATIACFIFILTRLVIFTLLLPVSEVYRMKARAYAYSMKRYWKYLLLDERSVT